ncbi:hypothetical protein C8A01DRAFT_47371 [Parachaetomium inaequale]|uniref:Uncharacterized protein n=1 Tax=Parachaetomium inaequale TaxID=2588326 RepID=A0AAN6SR77_9PEZI|nr:hypothetical protein C8A01DRAFT_47371 [Parachaetomium inaequale]
MTNSSPRDISGLSSPDPAASEGNSSVQVNVDSLSQRGRSIGRRSRSPSARPSPSRAPEQSLARQATANSLSSFLSSQPSSQPSQNDRPPPEDLLRDLIEITESSSDAISGALQGVKRPHDDETADEPLAKRDKLGEELERMFAAHPSSVLITVSSGSSAYSASAATARPTTANDAPTTTPSDPRGTRGLSNTLPIRIPRRRLPPLGNGTTMSRSGIPEASEPESSGDDDSEHSSYGRRTRGPA